MSEERPEKLQPPESLTDEIVASNAFEVQELERHMIRLRTEREHELHAIEKQKSREAACDHVFVIWHCRWFNDNPDDGRYALLSFFCQKCLAQREAKAR